MGAAVMLLLVGCGPESGEPIVAAEAERCVLPTEGAMVPPPRAMVLGEGTPEAFVPYTDGQTVSLRLGFQGGYMLTPRVRVAALKGDGDSACWQVDLNNEMALDWVGPGLVAQLLFERHGDAFYSGVMNNLINYDKQQLQGQPLTMDVTTSGIDIDETFSVSVILK